MAGFAHHLPADTTREELERLIDDLNADPEVSGILCQLPLPPHLDGTAIANRIEAGKDVDGLTIANAGRLMLGLPGLRPCTPAGVMVLLEEAGVELSGVHAVVLRRSNLCGKPMAQLLLAADATVSTCHSRTRDLAAVCRQADILIAAAGRPLLVQRLDQARCRRHRRGDQPDRRGSRRRRRLRGSARACLGHHTGAGRRRPDDHRLPASQLARGRARGRGAHAGPCGMTPRRYSLAGRMPGDRRGGRPGSLIHGRPFVTSTAASRSPRARSSCRSRTWLRASGSSATRSSPTAATRPRSRCRRSSVARPWRREARVRRAWGTPAAAPSRESRSSTLIVPPASR